MVVVFLPASVSILGSSSGAGVLNVGPPRDVSSSSSKKEGSGLVCQYSSITQQKCTDWLRSKAQWCKLYLALDENSASWLYLGSIG